MKLFDAVAQGEEAQSEEHLLPDGQRISVGVEGVRLGELLLDSSPLRGNVPTLVDCIVNACTVHSEAAVRKASLFSFVQLKTLPAALRALYKVFVLARISTILVPYQVCGMWPWYNFLIQVCKHACLCRSCSRICAYVAVAARCRDCLLACLKTCSSRCHPLPSQRLSAHLSICQQTRCRILCGLEEQSWPRCAPLELPSGQEQQHNTCNRACSRLPCFMNFRNRLRSFGNFRRQ